MPEWGKDRFDPIWKDLVALPGVREYWSERRHWFAPEMQSALDAIAAQPGGMFAVSYGDVSQD
jgi:hypothetical protein